MLDWKHLDWTQNSLLWYAWDLDNKEMSAYGLWLIVPPLIYPSTYPSVNPPVSPFFHLSNQPTTVYLPMYLWFHWCHHSSIHSLIYLVTLPFINPPTLSIHPSISTDSSIHQPTQNPLTHLSPTHTSIHPSIDLVTHTLPYSSIHPTHPFIHPVTHSHIHPPFKSIHPLTHPSTHQTIHPPIHSSIHPVCTPHNRHHLSYAFVH